MTVTVIRSDRPAWKVLAVAGFFGPDDTLYPEGSMLYYDGEPNEELEPLNDMAKERLLALLEKLDQYGREAAAKANRPFVGRPRTLDGAIQFATELQRNEMAVMTAKKVNVTSVEKIEQEVPETGETKRGVQKKVPLSKIQIA